MWTTLERHPRLLDPAIAAVLVGVGLLEGVLVGGSRPLWLHELLVVVVMGAVALRRRFPLTVLAVVVVGVMLIDARGQLSVFAALVIVAVTAGYELDGRRARLGLVLAVVPFWVGYALTDGQVSDYVAILLFYGGGWAVGQTVRERSRRVAEQADRADRAEREREERAALAVAAERTRIARELHDIVAHSISVITVQTQAVRRRLDPALTREIDDLKAVEATAREAMAEMRRLFGVLRADSERPSLEPQPGLDQLDRLIADTRAAGLPVDVVVQGEPVPLSPGLGLAAYRTVQEALTNVRKHAPGAGVRVDLRYGPHGLDVTVEDSGGALRGSRDGGGYGLVGMRERVALYGGSVEARPTGTGFTVHATLPFREGAAV